MPENADNIDRFRHSSSGIFNNICFTFAAKSQSTVFHWKKIFETIFLCVHILKAEEAEMPKISILNTDLGFQIHSFPKLTD